MVVRSPTSFHDPQETAYVADLVTLFAWLPSVIRVLPNRKLFVAEGVVYSVDFRKCRLSMIVCDFPFPSSIVRYTPFLLLDEPSAARTLPRNRPTGEYCPLRRHWIPKDLGGRLVSRQRYQALIT